jgi:hypothetical protein
MNIHRLAAATVAIVSGAALLATASPASAQPTPGRTAASVDPFARFSLTSAQADTLQAAIDKQLAATSGGQQISQNEVAYDNGHVIMTFGIPGQSNPVSSKVAAPDAVTDLKGCPESLTVDWTCVYEFADFNENASSGARRLQFDKCGGRDLNTWSFRDKTSSWVNTKVDDKVHVSNFTTTGSLVLLWVEPEGRSLSARVAPANDNKADYIDVRC